jgi:CTP:molybdopterin cytidylyltransferase MocA
LLAAGSGRRYGRPKALVDTGSGPWVLRALATLAGCDPSVVVVGARGNEVAALLPANVIVIDNPEHEQGMGSSLRVGLELLMSMRSGADGEREIEAALVMLVDLPGVGREVVVRVRSATGAAGTAPTALARATFHGVPGHPVLLGRDHWAGVIRTAHGDNGARDYLRTHPTVLVECGDIGSGLDVDVPEAT